MWGFQQPDSLFKHCSLPASTKEYYINNNVLCVKQAGFPLESHQNSVDSTFVRLCDLCEVPKCQMNVKAVSLRLFCLFVFCFFGWFCVCLCFLVCVFFYLHTNDDYCFFLSLFTIFLCYFCNRIFCCWVSDFFCFLSFKLFIFFTIQNLWVEGEKNISALDVTARSEGSSFQYIPYLFHCCFFTVVIFTLTTCTEAFRRLN